MRALVLAAGCGERLHPLTAGAAARLRNGDFIVGYGDNLSTIDIAALAAFHSEKDADVVMVTRCLEKPGAGEVFSQLVNAGYLVAKSWNLDALSADRQYDFGRDLLPRLINDGARVFGYRMTEPLWWIDSVEDYRRTQAAFAERPT